MTDFTALNRATYDEIAPLYARNQAERSAESGNDGRWYADLEDEFVRSVPRPGLLADLGCGAGRDAARLTAAGHWVVGLDLSRGMLALAAGALPGLVAQADLRALPIAAGSFDGLWCSAALLHIPQADTESVLAGFRRILRPGGALVLMTALGDGTRLEPVPYAQTRHRWFVYRRAAELRAELSRVGLHAEVEQEAVSGRHWLAVLARAT